MPWEDPTQYAQTIGGLAGQRASIYQKNAQNWMQLVQPWWDTLNNWYSQNQAMGRQKQGQEAELGRMGKEYEYATGLRELEASLAAPKTEAEIAEIQARTRSYGTPEQQERLANLSVREAEIGVDKAQKELDKLGLEISAAETPEEAAKRRQAEYDFLQAQIAYENALARNVGKEAQKTAQGIVVDFLSTMAPRQGWITTNETGTPDFIAFDKMKDKETRINQMLAAFPDYAKQAGWSGDLQAAKNFLLYYLRGYQAPGETTVQPPPAGGGPGQGLLGMIYQFGANLGQTSRNQAVLSQYEYRTSRGGKKILVNKKTGLAATQDEINRYQQAGGK